MASPTRGSTARPARATQVRPGEASVHRVACLLAWGRAHRPARFHGFMRANALLDLPEKSHARFAVAMSEIPDDPLTERAQHLLRVLVESYIREGQPVGSRNLSRDSGLNLSAATVRNVMADLEEFGFVVLAAHLRRPRAHGQGLPLLRRHAAAPAAAPRRRADAERAEPAARAGRRPRSQGAGRRRLADAVVADAPGRRRHDPAPAAPVAEPDRIPAAVREPRARGDGDQRPRRAEPHRPPRALLLGRGTASRRQFPQSAVRRQGTHPDPLGHRGRAHAGGRDAEPADARRDPRGAAGGGRGQRARASPNT